MKMLWRFSLFGILWMIVSCGGGVQRDDLLGKYALRGGVFSGTLELKDDGTCVQEFAFLSGKTEVAIGTWRFRPAGKSEVGGGSVYVYDGIVEERGKLVHKGPDYVIAMPVQSYFKELVLALDPDATYAYVKQK